MLIKFYNTQSSNNTINKVLSDEKEYTIKFKDIADMLNPVIQMQTDDLIMFNYAFLPHYKRYYFIQKIEMFPNGIYSIMLKCDVLESHKEEILNCDGYISKQANINKYYNSDYASETRKEVDIYESDVTIQDKKTYILTTIGG